MSPSYLGWSLYNEMFQRNIWGCEFILFNVKKKYIKVENAHEITSYVQEHTAINYTAMLEKLYNVMKSSVKWFQITQVDLNHLSNGSWLHR
jgi:hypothetical protein